jgi:hypothetical protein
VVKFRLRKILIFFSSLHLTILNLLGIILLVFFGTLEQGRSGLYITQEIYFHSWAIYFTVPWTSLSLPLFPGGYLFACVLLINIFSAIFCRFRFRWKNLGILLIHLGLALLIIGELYTSTFAVESQMTVRVGETADYSTSFNEVELIVSNSMGESTSIPQNKMKEAKAIDIPGTPLKLLFLKTFPNARFERQTAEEAESSVSANQGFGKTLRVIPLPRQVAEDKFNHFTAYVEVSNSQGTLGTWLTSNGISKPQEIECNGHQYQIQIRQRRYYHDFSIQLNKFTHEVHPETQIPKNFASEISLFNSKADLTRQASIFMNSPLYLNNTTVYQASYAEDDQVSIFQVVDNPGKVIPYYSSALVALGLVLQFFSSFSKFSRKHNDS